MDPSAPDNNNQNPDTPQPPSPIQPGQFVVASQDGMGQAPAQAPMPIQNEPVINPQMPQNPQMAQTYSPNPPPANGFTAAAYQNPAFQTQVPPQPAPPPQPDPTPFTPPGTPGVQPPAGGQPESKFPKIKILGIALGVISLLVIIGALVWFFVLNKNAIEPQSAVDEQVNEDQLTAPQPPEGFAELPESTTEASPETPAESPAAQTTPPAQ